MTILTAGGVNSVNTRVHYFLSFLGFFARTAEEITYFIIEIDRVGGFLQSHRSDFGTVFFFCKNMCVCSPGAQLTYFNDGGVRVIFLGLKFWPK